jgi:hypothetical protein
MWKVAVVTKQVTKTGALQPASIVSVFSLYNSANGRAPFSTTKFPGVDLPENVPEPALSSAQAQFRQGTGGRSSFTGNVITGFYFRNFH